MIGEAPHELPATVTAHALGTPPETVKVNTGEVAHELLLESVAVGVGTA
jgi:hypothetical protein